MDASYSLRTGYRNFRNTLYNALIFFYKDCLGQPLEDISALRTSRPARLRIAPSVEQTRQLLAACQDMYGYPTRLIVHLLYGCGLRVTEPCNLRFKDVDLIGHKLIIRQAKGASDRVVSLPHCLGPVLRDQIEVARIVWKQDVAAGIPLELPGCLATKYPRSQFSWNWAWVFPSHNTCIHPRTGAIVRYRIHEANVQRTVRLACQKIGDEIKPHELRHAYATHCLNRGQNPRGIQLAMGHKQLETTMGYLHAEALGVRSPLDGLWP
jgi:integrase